MLGFRSEKGELPVSDPWTDRFKDIWMFCMLDCGKGSLPNGPCSECVLSYAKTGPPDGTWNKREAVMVGKWPVTAGEATTALSEDEA